MRQFTNIFVLMGSVSLMALSAQAQEVFTIDAAATATNDGHVLNGGDSITITATGSVTATGANEEGLFATGAGNILTNDDGGTVTTDGNFADGLFHSGASGSIDNSGTVTTTGINADGLLHWGASGTISNSGTVSATGPGAYSVYFVGIGAELNLNLGSVLVGDVRFDASSSATLNVAPGLHTIIHTDASVPNTINVIDATYAIIGDDIHVFGATGFDAVDASSPLLMALLLGAAAAVPVAPPAMAWSPAWARMMAICGGSLLAADFPVRPAPAMLPIKA